MTVAVLLVSHDGARWLPAGPRRAWRPRPAPSTAPSPSTPAARTTAPTCSRGLRQRRVRARAARLDELSRRRRPRPRARCPTVERRVGLAAARRRQPAPGRARAAAAAPPRSTPTPTILGPKLREWPSLQAAARARRHHHRHRPPRDRARARRVRPGPARRGPRGPRGQHRRHAGTPQRARASSAVSTPQLPIFGNDIDFGWRAAPAGHTHARGARRPWSSTPRRPTAASGARRSPAATPTTRSAGPRCSRCWPTPPPRRLPWQVVRLALGSLLRMLGFLVVRSVGEALDELAAVLSRLLPARPGAAPPAAPARERRTGEPTRRAPPAGAAVAALPARPRLRQRPGGRRHQPGRRTSPSAAARPRRSSDRGARQPASARPRAPRRGRRGGLPPGHRPRGPLPHQPGRGGAGALRRARGRRRPRRPSARSPAARCPRCPPTSADWWQLHVESWHPLGLGHRRPRAGVRPAARLRRQPASAARRRRLGADAAGRPLRGLGRVAAAARRRPPRRHPRHAPLAARVGRGDLRPGPGHLGRVGRGPLRHRRRRRAAARGPPTPPSASPTPTATAAGAPAWRTGAARSPSVRPSCPGVWLFAAAGRGRRARRRPPSSPRGCCGTGTAGGRRSRPWRRCRCCWRRGSCPLVTTGSAAGPAARGRPAARRPGRRRRPADRPARRRSARRGGWARCSACSRVLALVPRSTRIPVLVCWLVALAAAVVVAGARPRHPRAARRPAPGRASASSSSSSRGWPSSPPCSAPRPTCSGSATAAARRRGSARSPACSPSSPRSCRSAAWSWCWPAPTGTRSPATTRRRPGVHGAELAARPRARHARAARLGRAEGIDYRILRGDGVTARRGRGARARRRGRRPRPTQVTELVSRPDRRARGVAGRARASSTSSCRRPPTAPSPPGSTPPPGSTRPAPRTASTRAWRVDRPLSAEAVEGRTGPGRGSLLLVAAGRSPSSLVLVLAAPTVRRGRDD